MVLLGALAPRLLTVPSALWWKFARALGYVNARILLTILFGIALIPLGVIWRLIGTDPLTRRRETWPGWSAYPDRYRSRNHYSRMY